MDARVPPDPARFGTALTAARAGDHHAQEWLYRRYAPSVLGYLRGSGAREPEDLTSEVFAGMIRGLRRFRGEERGFRAWLFTVARRRLQDERRRAAFRRQVPMEPADLPLPVDRESPEKIALGRLDAAEVLAALWTLTEEQRQVLLLRFVADLSVAETARLMAKEEGAVKMLQRRGLARLASTAAAEMREAVT